MALFNYATRELSAKIVYYGPGLSGKTTNIEMVHRVLRPEQKGRLISLPTETDRTLFFDFLPVDLGQIKGFKVRFHLYTVPGQVFYNATRRLVLQGVDGVVFIADSQVEMRQSNLESLKNLMENLATYGKRLEELPYVLQYNKRDLRQVLPVREMNALLNPRNVPAFEGIATKGVGVSETLVTISRMVFSNLRKTLLLPGEATEHKEAGDRAEAKIQRSFRPREVEPLEEISDLEEIQEVREAQWAEEEPVPVEPVDSVPDEIEIEAPEPAPPAPAAPAPPAASASARPEPVESVPDEIEIEIPETAPPPPAAPAPPAASAPARPEPVESVPGEIEIEIPEPAAPPPAAPAPPAASAPARPEPAESVPDEIEIEIPEPAPAPLPSKGARLGVSLPSEEEGLTFLKFENPYVSPEGHAVLPAVFMDDRGNIVRLRIRIAMEERG